MTSKSCSEPCNWSVILKLEDKWVLFKVWLPRRNKLKPHSSVSRVLIGIFTKNLKDQFDHSIFRLLNCLIIWVLTRFLFGLFVGNFYFLTFHKKYLATFLVRWRFCNNVVLSRVWQVFVMCCHLGSNFCSSQLHP